MRVKGSVQLSTYRMRSFQVQVAEEFLAHVKSLPLAYDKGIYFAFLEDYGTHYTRSGKTGGEYELVYVLDQDTIKDRRVSKPQSQKEYLLFCRGTCDEWATFDVRLPCRTDTENAPTVHQSRHQCKYWLHALH